MDLPCWEKCPTHQPAVHRSLDPLLPSFAEWICGWVVGRLVSEGRSVGPGESLDPWVNGSSCRGVGRSVGRSVW